MWAGPGLRTPALTPEGPSALRARPANPREGQVVGLWLPHRAGTFAPSPAGREAASRVRCVYAYAVALTRTLAGSQTPPRNTFVKINQARPEVG